MQPPSTVLIFFTTLVGVVISQDCDTLFPKEKIIVNQKSTDQDSHSVVPAFIGVIGEEYKFLYCHEETVTGNNKHYTLIKSQEGKHDITIKDIDCSSKEFLKNVYMFYFKTDEKNYLALGSKGSEEEKWCRYDICLDCDISDIKVNIDSKPMKEMIKWSEPGVKIDNNPSFKKKFIAIDNDGNELKEDNLVAEYFTNSFYVHFRVQCYETKTSGETKYTSIMRSARGLHLGTFTDVNCLDEHNLFDTVYLHITKGTETIFTNHIRFRERPKKEEWFCWYFGCNKPEDPTEETRIFYIFNGSNEKNRMVTWNKEEHNIKNSCPQLKKEDILIENSNNIEERAIVVAKYIRKAEPKYQLLCYQEIIENKFKYTFVVKDSGGQHIVTISGHNCTPKNAVPSEGIYLDVDISKSNEAKDFILVGSASCMYSICKNCDKSNIEVYHDYSLAPRYYWKMVSIDECPTLKRENIHLTENEIQVDEANIVTRYLLDDPSGKGTFLLYCYRAGETEQKEYVSVVKTVEGSHAVSIKGVDCSSIESMSKNSYFSYVSTPATELLVLGTRAVSGEHFGLWCQYDIYLKSKTFRVNPHEISPGEFCKLSQAGIHIKSCPSLKDAVLPEDSKGNKLKSENIVAEYVESKGSSLVLDCYAEVEAGGSKDYFLAIRTSQGHHIATIPSLDCSKTDNIIKTFYIYTKKKDNKVEIFKVGEPTTDMCWKTDDKSKFSDIWLYVFPAGEGSTSTSLWKKEEKPNNCPDLKNSDITTTNEETEHENKENTAHYHKEGNPQFSLHCYKVTGDKEPYYFATIYNTENQHVVTIRNFDCSPAQNVAQRLYVHTMNGNDGSILVGSRHSSTDRWCWYIVHTKWEKENVWVYRDYVPVDIASQWKTVSNPNTA